MSDYATGRTFSPLERILFKGGAADRRVATDVARLGQRGIPVREALAPRVVARAAWAAARA